MATPFPPLKIQITYLNSSTPKTTPYTQKVSRCLVQNSNQCNFGLFWPKFGCHGNSLCSLENSNNIFEFTYPKNYTLHTKSVSISCTELKSVAYLANFCPNLVAMATPFVPVKIQITYLNSPTLKTTPYVQKVSRYLVQNGNLCNFGLFLPKFGCHGNSLCSLENSDSIFEFTDPENPAIDARSVTISCTEMKLCLFECFAYLYHSNFHDFCEK